MIHVLLFLFLDFFDQLVHSAACLLLPPTLLFPQQESIFAAVLLLYRVSVSAANTETWSFAITFLLPMYVI